MDAAERKEHNAELLMQLHKTAAGTQAEAEIMGELWEHNVGLVRWTVRRMTGLIPSDDGFEDMVQQAYFGFAAAAQKYDTATADVEFSTYVIRHIEWGLSRYYERNGYTIRIPQHMRHRMKECEEKRQELERSAGRHITREAALETMGLSEAAIKATLEAFRKVEDFASLDAPVSTTKGDDVGQLMDFVAAEGDMENAVISQEWHRELHTLLMDALQELSIADQGILVRHYFQGVSLAQIAEERRSARQTIHNQRSRALLAMRAGRYGPELAEFMPDMSAKETADRLIRRAREDVERLKLSSEERELLAL